MIKIRHCLFTQQSHMECHPVTSAMLYSRDTKIHGSPSYILWSLWHGKSTTHSAQSPANSSILQLQAPPLPRGCRPQLVPWTAHNPPTPPSPQILAPTVLSRVTNGTSFGVVMTKSPGVSLTFRLSCEDRKGTEKALVLDWGHRLEVKILLGL